MTARRALPAGGARVVAADAETVDVGELARSVRRQWRTVLAWALLGLAAAGAIVLFVPPRFAAVASLLLRSSNDASSSVLSRIGLPTDLAPAALDATLKSPLETELQLLVSRDVLGAVVDSLGLQARTLAPRGIASRRLLVPAAYAGAFRRRTYEFERAADGSFHVSGSDTSLAARPGVPFHLPVVGTVTIAESPAASRFRIRFEDREDAISRVAAALGTDKKGGEVVALAYTGPDSLSAAAVPNAIVATYLERRRTVDRGVNQRRYEFLSLQADSVATQLAGAEDALRGLQERTGVLDPELSGKLGAEAARTLREQSGAVEVERRALGHLLDEVASGGLSPRQLAAYPTFLKSDAINAILTQMATLETERTRLLERRTAQDPEVVAIATSVSNLEQQLTPLGRTYQTSLDREQAELTRQLGTIEGRLAALPGQAESSLQGQRRVKQLAQTFGALQAQIVDARLAAIGEGGRVRRIDDAVAPKRPTFPRPEIVLPVGLAVGLLLGVGFALVRGALDGRVWTPGDAERATGLPTFALRPGAPPLLGVGVRAGTLLVVPADEAVLVDTLRIARFVAAAAEQRGEPVAVIDGHAASTPAALREALSIEEGRQALVVAGVATLHDPRTIAVLDERRSVMLATGPGASRDAIARSSDALGAMGVPCVGLVFVVAPASATDVSRPPSAVASGFAPRTAPLSAPALGGARAGTDGE